MLLLAQTCLVCIDHEEHLRKQYFYFECFPYICPEPALAKPSCLASKVEKEGERERFFETYRKCIPSIDYGAGLYRKNAPMPRFFPVSVRYTLS